MAGSGPSLSSLCCTRSTFHDLTQGRQAAVVEEVDVEEVDVEVEDVSDAEVEDDDVLVEVAEDDV